MNEWLELLKRVIEIRCNEVKYNVASDTLDVYQRKHAASLYF